MVQRILVIIVCLVMLASPLHAEHPDPEGLLRLDIMSLLLKGDREAAILKITKFLADNPNHPQRGEFLARRGTLRVDSGDNSGGSEDLRSAIPLLDRAIAADPKNDSLIYIRARARQASNDRDGAMADFRRALELKPESGEYKLGLMLAEQGR